MEGTVHCATTILTMAADPRSMAADAARVAHKAATATAMPAAMILAARDHAARMSCPDLDCLPTTMVCNGPIRSLTCVRAT